MHSLRRCTLKSIKVADLHAVQAGIPACEKHTQNHLEEGIDPGLFPPSPTLFKFVPQELQASVFLVISCKQGKAMLRSGVVGW